MFRSIQYLPYKTFNLAAGILNMNFFNYTLLTITGSIIRCLSLIYFGKLLSINKTTLATTIIFLFITGCLLLIFKYIKYDKE